MPRKKEEKKEQEKPPKKREYGTGSIYRRASDNRYVGTSRVNGKRKTVYGDTRADVRAKLEELQRQVRAGQLLETGRVTLAEFLDHWIGVRSLKIKPQTRENYCSSIRAHIVPSLGMIMLQALSMERIQQWIGGLIATNISASSVRKHFTVLKMALDDAVRWKKIASNPCRECVLPLVEEPESEVLDDEQVQTLLFHLKRVDLKRHTVPHSFAALIILALSTGMREGELLSLRWADVNLEKAELRVRRNLVYIRGQGFQEGTPKSKKSRRPLALPDFVVQVLRAHAIWQAEHRAQMADQWHEQDLVFPNRYGGYQYGNAVNARFQRLLKTAGLPALRFHDLRHSAGTFLIAMGVDLSIVSRILGHSSIKITSDRYLHISLKMQRPAMDNMHHFLLESFREEEQ